MLPIKIQQIDLGTKEVMKIWDSAMEAEKEKGYNSRRISQVCKGKEISSNGYGWRYDGNYGDEFLQKEKSDRNRKQIIKLNLRFSNESVYLSEINTYESIEETKNKENISALGNCLDNNKEYKFSYIKNHLFLHLDWYQENKLVFIKKLEESKDNRCLLCDQVYITQKALASHIQFDHKITTESYTIQTRYDSVKPTCKFKGCSSYTRYTTYSFKDFCKEHATEAMSNGGKVGGVAEAWSKGKTKFNDPRLLQYSINVSGQGNHFYGKTHSQETIDKLKINSILTKEQLVERLKKREKDFTFNFSYEDYKKRQDFKIECVCKKCNRKWNKRLVNIERGSMCQQCYPSIVSRAEIEVGDFIEEELGISIVRSDRKTIYPKELDICIPDKNFAIEYNGLYWHMDKGEEQFSKSSHKDKANACKDKNIQLFHIFSDEWEENEDLIKSMISSRLGKCTAIGARKLVVEKELASKEYREFFNQSHISGFTNSSKTFSLKDSISGEIMCALSLRKPFQKFYSDSVEIARFSTKPFYNVQGGFSRLLKEASLWAKQNGYKSILSYCDIRFGEGGVYAKNGFNLIGETDLNYWYTDGVERFDRFKFRAKDGKPEKQIAEEAGVYKVYGCGNKIYLLNLT